MKLDDINNIAIIGTGMIGASLAALFTGNGYSTTMLAMSERGEQTGLVRYQTHYQDLAQKGLVTEAQAAICRSYLTITRDIDAIRDADFIVECLAENLEVKHRIYQRVEEHCDKFRAIVSTTSAISPKDLCCKMKAKERLAVTHPYNPPHLVPCVEIVPSEYTSPETMQFIEAFLRSVGREPVTMQKEAPGFIANRLQHALFREAVYMVEAEIASPEAIDQALRTSFAPRYTSIGIFEHFDYAGLDMIISIEDYLFPTLCNARETQGLIREKYERGELGFKTGRGVYDWSKKDADDFRRRSSEPYFNCFNWSLPTE